MFKHYFEQVQHIGIFPVISLIIFFSFFLLLILWLIKVDKNHISQMRELPLDLDVTKNEAQHSENIQS